MTSKEFNEYVERKSKINFKIGDILEIQYKSGSAYGIEVIDIKDGYFQIEIGISHPNFSNPEKVWLQNFRGTLISEIIEKENVS